MRVLVTGGAGYVGSFIARGIARRGHDVVVVDDLSSGTAEAVEGLPLVVADVRDGDAMGAVFSAERPRAVVHLAGRGTPSTPMQAPVAHCSANVHGTMTVLETAARHGVRSFVYSSSAAVYGGPHICPLDEGAALRPLSGYGASKLAAEAMVPWYAKAASMRYCCLRVFNVGGAAADVGLSEYRQAQASQLIPTAIRAAATGTSLPVFGTHYPTADGTALRDYVHVEDVAEAHVKVLERLPHGDVDGTYNVGRGVPVSVLEVVDAIREVSGVAINIVPRPERPGDAAASWADVSLMRRTFRFEASRDITDVVGSAWSWHSTGRSPGVTGI